MHELFIEFKTKGDASLTRCFNVVVRFFEWCWMCNGFISLNICSHKYDFYWLTEFILFGSEEEYDYSFTSRDIVELEAWHGYIVSNVIISQYNFAF